MRATRGWAPSDFTRTRAGSTRSRVAASEADVLVAIELVRAGTAVRVTIENAVGLERRAAILAGVADRSGVAFRLVRTAGGRASRVVVGPTRG